jgi:hypothetical protein
MAPTPQGNMLAVIAYVIGVFGPLVLFFMALRYRESSRWIRLLFFASTLVGSAWAALGFIRLFYAAHFSRQARWSLDHWRTHVAGIAVGLLISALLSSDFWQLSRHYRSWLR